MVAVPNNPKVAIVCDWLIGGGAEKVVYELHLLYPEAPIFTSYCTPEWKKRLAPSKVITGYTQRWPFSKMRKFIPKLRQKWFESLSFKDFDIVISASGAEAKGVNVPEGVKHISYIHAPTHYYWSRYNEYLKNPGFGAFDWFARTGLKAFIAPMKHWDYLAAQKPDLLIANSDYTKKQIEKYYNRDSIVIHPPIRTAKFNKYSQDQSKRDGFIIIGRQTPYKRIDLAVKACSKLNKKLIVVGNGPQNRHLKKIAGPSVEFFDHVYDDKKLADLIGSSEAFVFPGLDDFGIAAVEALAAGTPVIAYKAGGALDYIKPGKNGEFFKKRTVASLSEALLKFDASKYTSSEIKRTVDRFSIEEFRSKISRLVDSV